MVNDFRNGTGRSLERNLHASHPTSSLALELSRAAPVPIPVSSVHLAVGFEASYMGADLSAWVAWVGAASKLMKSSLCFSRSW